jgi:hypothetical protein
MRLIAAEAADLATLWMSLWRSDASQHPFGSLLNAAYSRAYAEGCHYVDRSFVIADDDGPVMGMQIALLQKDDAYCELSAFGRPVLYLEARGVSTLRMNQAIRLLKERLASTLDEASGAAIHYIDFLAYGKLSHAGQLLLENSHSVARPMFTRIVTLSADEEQLKRNVRKSYKSLIHWGLKHLDIKVLDRDMLTPEDVERFRQLHIQEAGRETRSAETWAIQFDQVMQGEAFVVLGELDGELVTAAFFLYSARYCYYGVSASVRSLFDKPLSHGILWTAMLHARKIGCTEFEFGEELYPAIGNPSPKELGISLFKKGFGGETRIYLHIHRPFGNPAGEQELKRGITL